MYLAAAFTGAACVYGLILACSGIYPFGNKSVLLYDMGNQYAVFHDYFRQVLHGDASIGFTWRGDLGLNFLPIFAYYLASPFSLLMILAPEQYVPEVIVLIMMAKMGAGAAAMAAYLRRIAPGGKRLAVAFSIPYAVCAWAVAYSFNIMWLDVIYLLPLMLIGVEVLLRRGRALPLAGAVAAAMLVNYYMAGIMLPFVAVMAVFRYLDAGGSFRSPAFRSHAVRAAVAIGLGALSSGLLLLPSLNGLKNGRTNLLGSDPIPVPVGLSAQTARLFGGTYDWFQGSPNLAAGTVMLVAATLFPLCRRIPRAERLRYVGLAVLLIGASQTEMVFLLFHDGERPNAFPFRYAFLFAALLVIMGYRALAALERDQALALIRNSALLWLAILVTTSYANPDLLRPPVALAAAVAVGLGAVALSAVSLVRNPGGTAARKAVGFLTAVLVADTFTAGLLESQGQPYAARGVWNAHPSMDWDDALRSTAPQNGEFFRSTGIYDNFLNGSLRSQNESLRYGNYDLNHFSSLASGKLHAALGKLGFTEHIYQTWTAHTGATLLTDALLGYRYFVTTEPLDRSDTVAVRDYESARVYQNTATLPVGFLAPGDLAGELTADDPFTAQEQIFDLPGAFAAPCRSEPAATGAVVDRTPDGQTMYTKKRGVKNVTVTWFCEATGSRSHELYAWADNMPWAGLYPGADLFKITVSGKKPAEYPDVYNNGILDLGHMDGTSFMVTLTSSLGQFTVPKNFIRALDVKAVDAKIAELNRHALTDVRTSGYGLSGTIDADHAGQVFLSVPDIHGWTVKVDGKKVAADQVLSAFMAVPVSAGTHRISLDFRPPGLRGGALLSLVGVGGLALLWRRENRRPQPGPDLGDPGEPGEPGADDPLADPQDAPDFAAAAELDDAEDPEDARLGSGLLPSPRTAGTVTLEGVEA